MKLYYFVFIFFFFSCAGKEGKEDMVIIDFNNSVSSIPYSHFVDSLSYFTLELGDSLLMSGINLLYIDGNYLLTQDYELGLFIFSLKDGSLIKHINYFGSGPEEFSSFRTFTFDSQKKQAIIYSYPFLKKYTYDGAFVESIQCADNNTADFYHTNIGTYICMSPERNGPEGPCGVWLVDSTFQYIKQLKKIPANQKLYTSSQFYNRAENGIYYYDRVWDDFTYITDDSVEVLYRFDFKQRVPAEIRDRENPFETLGEYSMINDFANSDCYLLMNYFNIANYEYTWALFDKSRNEVICSKQLVNDISAVSKYSRLFYVNNQTWCRVLEFEEENSAITLEFMHISTGCILP